MRILQMAETDVLEEQEEEETFEGQGSAQEQEAVERSRVHPLDLDFLVFAMPFAMLVDAVDIILELTSVFIIPKVIGIVIDIFVFVVISWWMYKRVRRIAEAKKQARERTEQIKQQVMSKVQGFQQRASSQLQGLKQQALKAAGRGPLRRVLTRGAVVLLGELIPFVGILPFWTIAVFSTLREK